MQIHCRYCASEIPAANINLDNLIAKCANCNAVFSIAGEVGAGQGIRDKEQFAQRAMVPMPKGVDIKEEFDALVIRREWLNWTAYPLAFFALFWNGFMVMWFGISISTGAWPMAAFGSIHGAVGLFLIYQTLCNFMNITSIRVSGGELTIRHNPIPAPGTRTLPADDIAQIYSKMNYTRSSRGGGSTTYEVLAIMRDQRRESLLKNLINPEQALFIEQEIERFLRIEDRSVPGELERY